MKFSKFQKKIEDLKAYPENVKVVLPAIFLGEETGEVLKPIKHTLRTGDPYDKDSIAEEMGDVLLCLANLSIDLDLDLDKIAENAVDKLTDRMEDRDDEEKQ